MPIIPPIYIITKTEVLGMGSTIAKNIIINAAINAPYVISLRVFVFITNLSSNVCVAHITM